MNLGAFSISLAVKDLKTSKEFYEKLGFTVFAGSEEHNYLIMDHEGHKIGLFQGMFDQNILTFNPGWDQNAQPLDEFTDVRQWQKKLKADGLQFAAEANEDSSGPASFVIVDPDGNSILVDQHV
ncbi:MAG: VOC family protein [Planctomycetota bacterium]